MKGKDEIKDLFSNKLGNFEAQVRPDMWANIASQIGGASATVATTGLSLLSKTFIGIGIGAAVVATVFIVTPSSTLPVDKKEKSTSSNVTPLVSEPEMEDANPTAQKENIISTPEKKENIQLDNSSPADLVNNSIDQTQNFRTDISLIDVKKDKQLKERVVEKNNVVKDTPIIGADKPKVGGTKVDNEVLKTVEPKEVAQPEIIKTSYSLEALPNVFTPDNDGANDFLSITSEGLMDFTVVVFDDQQKVVFESNNPDFKWDGIDKFGNKVKPGTYGYYIIARDSNGNKVNKFTALQIVF